MNEFNKIIQELVRDCQIPVRELAKALGKPYSTLMREVNPHDKGAKLGVETCNQLMLLTKNVRLLEYAANQLGFSLVPREEQVLEDTSQDIILNKVVV